MPKTPAKRRGRPPLPPGEGKRGSFTTRIKPALKAELEEAAAVNGRSLSEEIEFRLERSSAFGSSDNYSLGLLVAHTKAKVEEYTSKSIHEDPETRDMFLGAVVSLLRNYAKLPQGMKSDRLTTPKEDRSAREALSIVLRTEE